MRRSVILTALILWAASLCGYAVTPEERLASGTSAAETPDAEGTNYYLSEDDTQAVLSSGDSDLGEQVILERQMERSPIKARAEAHLFWSDNLGADATDPEDGWFFVGSLGARWKQRLSENLFLDTFAYQDAYLYDTDGYDFESSEFGVGFLGSPPEYPDITIYGRYEFLYVHADDPGFPATSTDDRVTTRSHRLRFGTYQTLYQDTRNSLVFSTQARFDVDAHPSRLERRQFSARLGYYRRLTRQLQLSAYSKVSHRNYRNSDREDVYVYGGLDLTYRLSRHARFYASVLYGHNDSNRPGGASDYEAWQTGLGLGLRAKF